MSQAISLLLFPFILIDCVGKVSTGAREHSYETKGGLEYRDSLSTMDESEPLYVTVDLTDGSRLNGFLEESSIPLQTPYASVGLPLGSVQWIRFESDRESTSVVLQNGDRMTGVVSVSQFRLVTLVGPILISTGKIRSMRISRPAVTLSESLSAYYPFNGNANDESGNDKNGTVSGPELAADRFGKPGSAYYFDGDRDYISIPDGLIGFAEPFSISMWCLAQDTELRRCALYTGAYTAGESEMGVASGFARFAVHLENEWVEARAPVPRNKLFHFVSVYYPQEKIQIWLDGQLKSEIRTPAGDLVHGSPVHNASIGSYAPLQRQHAEHLGLLNWSGTIDDIRIYRRALTEWEIGVLFRLPQ